MNPCRSGQAAADSAPMPHTANPSGLDTQSAAPIASRRPWPSGRKNAHRGLAACRRPASGQPCSQVLIASGKNRRLPTTARRSHLLQQSKPNHGQCPKPGFWSNVGNALTNFGSDVHGAGTEASRIGAVTAVVGAGATLVQPEIGAPVLFAGGVFIGVGKLGEGVGTVLSLAGGAILAVEGNSQPFQSAAVDMAQSQFDDNIHLPPGVPSPAQPVADAMSGENPCP
jgi:hypothetical protein